MIRYLCLLSVLAAPLSAQTTMQDRPGRWISVPGVQASAVPAPALAPTILEAPASGPSITADPMSDVLLIAPEPGLEAATPIVPPSRLPATRPLPRLVTPPVEEVVEIVALPEGATPRPTGPEPEEVATTVAELQPVEGDRATAPSAVAADLSTTIGAAQGDARVMETAAVRPAPRLEAEATAALAEALAAQISADAIAIAVTAPRDVPLAQDIPVAEVLAPVRATVVPEVAAPTPLPVPAPGSAPVPVRDLTPPAAVPMLLSAFAPVTRSVAPVRVSAVLLPDRAAPARPVAQPVAFVIPPVDPTPILPRLRPSGPFAMVDVGVLSVVQTAPLSAVLVPSRAGSSAPVPYLVRSVAPAYDLFPFSALPRSALPEGPESQARAIQPPRPFAEANAAVLTGLPPALHARLSLPSPARAPIADAPVPDPDAPVQLPEPDANALARMMEDAMICWRLADLTVEAQWARLSVDVALDETNMPSAASIRLTGFAQVVSGAAENAYRAAHSALVGCAGATANAPATTPATLTFDRNGVRLR